MNTNGRLDTAWAAYAARFRSAVLPQMQASGVVVQIYGGVTDFDVRQATELGALLLLGKPLIVISTAGVQIPDGLRRAADAVVEGWDLADPESDARLRAVLADIVREHQP